MQLDYGEPPDDAADFARHVVALGKDLESWQKIAIPGSPLPVPYLEVIQEALESPEDTYISLRGSVKEISVTTRIEPAPTRRAAFVGGRP